jgi:S-adenosylmethionine:tRNA ribosyltransferase-isomerase
LRTDDFDYTLPPEQIAQHPAEPRDSSRLLVFDRSAGSTEDTVFNQLPRFLKQNDVLVLNETRVLPARLFARKLPGGGKVELLLLKRRTPKRWEALVGGKGLKPDRNLELMDGSTCRILDDLGGPKRLVEFDREVETRLPALGEMPLPPYIHEPLQHPDQYQTVFAREPGSAAAPTAGLHFTPSLLERMRQSGTALAYVTLHVGLDTFAPVREADPERHEIHSEWCSISQATAETINQRRSAGGRVIAVGTTTVRTLETAARVNADGKLSSFEGQTELYILPGFEFLAVDAMITNFHLPRSTLLMLVSAFAGRERVLALYQHAISAGYRFYSFGDAMLIL